MLGDHRFRARLGTYVMAACLSACATTPKDQPAAPQTAATERSEPVPRPQRLLRPVVAPVEDVVPADTNVVPDLWRVIGAELRQRPQRHYPIGDAGEHFGNSSRYLKNAAANARPFLFHIHEEISRRRLPVEILLLPMVESAYNPAATSPGGAAGIWQLIPATAQRFDLHLSRWYDGRRDVLASTRAALDYLEFLSARFDADLPLMLAAYNAGERTVEMAIERNRQRGRRTDFWSLDLPRTTRAYVPKILALAEIVSDPAAHGVKLSPLPATRHFETVDVGTELDLNRVIDWSGMVGAEFEQLNAAFRRRFTVTGAPTTVLVPHGRAAAVETKLATLPASARRATPPPAAAQGPFHVVVSGDNLWDIARRYGISVSALATANGLDQKAPLRLGRRLRLPGVEQPALAAAPTTPPARYEVRRGDSLWTIARRFKISIADLKRWNGLSDRLTLQPGQRLLVSEPDPAMLIARDS
ncbi:MAG: LysM peptidoglycan-binding domain-containing protein [Gammaproteobacteria bacterium]